MLVQLIPIDSIFEIKIIYENNSNHWLVLIRIRKNLDITSITLKISFYGIVSNLINPIHTSIIIQKFLSITNLTSRVFPFFSFVFAQIFTPWFFFFSYWGDEIYTDRINHRNRVFKNVIKCIVNNGRKLLWRKRNKKLINKRKNCAFRSICYLFNTRSQSAVTS